MVQTGSLTEQKQQEKNRPCLQTISSLPEGAVCLFSLIILPARLFRLQAFDRHTDLLSGKDQLDQQHIDDGSAQDTEERVSLPRLQQNDHHTGNQLR